jgi:hypothetical protein
MKLDVVTKAETKRLLPKIVRHNYLSKIIYWICRFDARQGQKVFLFADTFQSGFGTYPAPSAMSNGKLKRPMREADHSRPFRMHVVLCPHSRLRLHDVVLHYVQATLFLSFISYY